MPNVKIALRSVLSISLLSALGISAHAVDPYVELYQNSPTVQPHIQTATVANNSNSTELNGTRVATQQRIVGTPATNNTAMTSLAVPTRTGVDNTVLPNNTGNHINNINVATVATPPGGQMAIQNTPYMRPALPPNAMPSNVRPINNVSPINNVATGNVPQPVAVPRSATSIPVAPQAAVATQATGASASSTVPMPTVNISLITYVPNVIIPVSTNGNEQLDVSLLDVFIDEMSSHARHYPPNFPNASEKYYSTQELDTLEEWLRPYAERPDASYEVLLRAAKLNGMARNLDFGSEYAVRGSNYVARALEKQPNSQEANFLYGIMLAEGGGFNEGKKYLDRAAQMGYLEAEQSLAQSDLLSDNRPAALQRLQRLQTQNPNNEQIRRQIRIVQDGDYYIWDLDQ